MTPNILVFGNKVSEEIAALIFAVEMSSTLMMNAVNAFESLLTTYETAYIATLLNFSYLFTFNVANLICVLVGLYAIQQGCTNPGRQAPLPTELYTVAPSTCGFSVCNWLHFSILAPGI
jgi:hypothetical protein